MLSYDKQLKLELYLNDKKFNNKDIIDNYEGILLILIRLLKKEKTIKAIWKRLEKINLRKDFEKQLLKIIKEEYDLIYDEYKIEKKLIPIITLSKILSEEGNEGVSFGFTFQRRENTIKKKIIRFLKSNFYQIIEDKRINRQIDDEIKNFTKYDRIFFQDQVNRYRNYINNNVDKELDFIGWQSVAVIDKRTSQICMSLHGAFYSKKEYTSRLNIPNLPPRHPNCRSIIIRVENKNQIDNYSKQDLQDFFERNPKDAKELLGKEKYEIWKENKLKASELYNNRERKLYTNDELKNIFNLK